MDVRSYYVGIWGQPDDEAWVATGKLKATVLKWTVGEKTDGVTMYATLGGSDYPLPGHDETHRQEFFIGLEPECDEMSKALGQLALYAQLSGRVLADGHFCRFAGGLVDGLGFSGFAVLTSAEEPPTSLLLPDRRHVEFLMAVPLFDDELNFASVHGVDGLMEEMDSRDVPLWEPGRVSAFHVGGSHR